MNPSAGKLPNASTVKIHNLALFQNLKKSKLHLQCSFNDMLQKAIAIQSGTLIKILSFVRAMSRMNDQTRPTKTS